MLLYQSDYYLVIPLPWKLKRKQYSLCAILCSIKSRQPANPSLSARRTFICKDVVKIFRLRLANFIQIRMCI